MKSLFSTIEELNQADDFSVHFAYLNLINGWELIDKLPCNTDIKNKLVLYTNHAYNPESPLYRQKKDRLENKLNAIRVVGLNADKFILECVYNKNKQFNDFVWWYIQQLKDRDFAVRIALEESMFQLFKLSSEGIDTYFNVESLKDLSSAMKYFQKMEVTIRADAMKRAMEMKDRIEALEKKLEVKFQHLKSIVKHEIPEVIDDEGWQEFEVFSRKQNDS